MVNVVSNESGLHLLATVVAIRAACTPGEKPLASTQKAFVPKAQRVLKSEESRLARVAAPPRCNQWTLTVV